MSGWLPALGLSLRIAVVATAADAVLGTLAAWAVVKLSWRGKGLADSLFTLPVVLPPTVTGFLLLVLLGRNGPVGRLAALLGGQIVFTWWAGAIASAVVAFPLMYSAARAGLQAVDPALEKAARTLGASEARIFFTVTLPLAWPGIAAGLVLAFTRALGEFGATLMVAGNIPGRTQTMPTAIYTAAQTGDMKGAAGLVALMLVFGLAATGLARVCSDGYFARHVRSGRS